MQTQSTMQNLMATKDKHMLLSWLELIYNMEITLLPWLRGTQIAKTEKAQNKAQQKNKKYVATFNPNSIKGDEEFKCNVVPSQKKSCPSLPAHFHPKRNIPDYPHEEDALGQMRTEVCSSLIGNLQDENRSMFFSYW